jgi:hypothetical protein
VKKVALVVAGVIAGVVSAHAGTIASGFTANTLDPCDDCYDSAPLGFTIDFYGQNFSSAFVSNNGYLTFNAGQFDYSPTGPIALYTGQPIIAAFYADVYTQTTGTVTYGTGTLGGNNAFGATWSDVPGGGLDPNLTNTFQEIIVDRSDIAAGDADIYLNYQQIQWDAGAYLGLNKSAVAGYASGTGLAGTYGQLDGSLVAGAFLDGGPNALVAGTNDGTPGQFVVQLRAGVVTMAVDAIPEPAGLPVLGLGLSGLALLRRRRF